MFTAYIASVGLTEGAATTDVFRVTATAAFLAYGLSSVTNSIWKGVPWSTTAKFLFDGVLYAAATAGAFAWLWPAAAA